MTNKAARAWALLAALCLAAALGGCGAPKKSAPLSSVYEAMQAANVLPEMVPLDAQTAMALLGLDTAQCKECALYISADGLLADEVLLVRAANQEEAKAMQALLAERLQFKAEEARAYSPQQYAIIQQGKLLHNGLSLALIVSPKADELEKIYQTFDHR